MSATNDHPDIPTSRSGDADRRVLALHPALARIAVEYSRLRDQYSRGELDLAEVGRRVSELDAVDDDGLHWRINPSDGGWMYRSRAGAMVPASPPAYGRRELTPFDLTDHVATGSQAPMNPDVALRFQTEPRLGALQPPRRLTQPSSSRRTVWWLTAAGVLAVVVAVLATARCTPAPTEVTAPPVVAQVE